jgi:hypothetical protein
MEDNYKEVSLDTLNSGAVKEMFQAKLEEVLENIGDDNTEAKKTRKITIEISFLPNETREIALTKVEVKTSMAPIKASSGTVFLSSDGSKISAKVSDPKQGDIFDNVIDMEGKK